MGVVTETTSRKRIFSMQQIDRSATWSSPYSLTSFITANESEPFQKRARPPFNPGTTFRWEPELESNGKPQMSTGNVNKDLAVRTPLPANWQSSQLREFSPGLSTPAIRFLRENYQLEKRKLIERDLWHSKLAYSTGLAEDALDRVGRPAIGLKLTLGYTEPYYQRYINAKRELEDYKRVVQAVNSYVPLNANGRRTLSSIKRRGSNLQQGPSNLYGLQAITAGVSQKRGSWSRLNRGSQMGGACSTSAHEEALSDEYGARNSKVTFTATPDRSEPEESNGQDASTVTSTVEDTGKREHWQMLKDRAQDPERTAKIEAVRKDAEALELHFARMQLHREEDEASRVKARQAKKTDVVSEAFTALSREAEDAVDDALHNGPRHETLVLHDETNIEVTRAIIQCLLPGAWLNDEVINVYMQLLKEREIREPKKFLKCHFFNTFFYNKLFKDKQSYDYKSVRRWTTQKKIGYSLADCDKILVPIHQDIHWCLAVINIRENRIEYLDSLKGGDTDVLKVLARYIVDEAKDKSNRVLDVSKWERAFPDVIPDQLNGCDCGMFMVKYADFHSRGVPLSFTQEHMEYFRRRTVHEILQLEAN